MNDALFGLVVTPIAALSGVYLGAWLQNKYQRESTEAVARTIFVNGGLQLLPNIHTVLGVMGELEQFNENRNAIRASLVAASVSLLEDPLCKLPTEVPRGFDMVVTALSDASIAVRTAKLFLSKEYLAIYADDDAGNRRRVLDGFLDQIIESHYKAIGELRKHPALCVLSQVWTAEAFETVMQIRACTREPAKQKEMLQSLIDGVKCGGKKR